jgi:hypothetical protein
MLAKELSDRVAQADFVHADGALGAAGVAKHGLIGGAAR